MGQASPQPIVTTASAARTTSSVSGLGNSSCTSRPSSASASTTAGLISSAGWLPAERTWTRPSARMFSRAAAIWLRPAFCTQTNRTSGTSLTIVPSAWPSARSRSRAKRCTSTGTKSGKRACGSVSCDSLRKRAIVSREKTPWNSSQRASSAFSTCRRVIGSSSAIFIVTPDVRRAPSPAPFAIEPLPAFLAAEGLPERPAIPVARRRRLPPRQRHEVRTPRDRRLVVERVAEERRHRGPAERAPLRVDEQRPRQRLVAVALHRRDARRDAAAARVVHGDQLQPAPVLDVVGEPEVAEPAPFAGHALDEDVVVLGGEVVRAAAPRPAVDRFREEVERARVGARAEEPQRHVGEARPHLAPVVDVRAGVPDSPQLFGGEAVHPRVAAVHDDRDPVVRHVQREPADVVFPAP